MGDCSICRFWVKHTKGPSGSCHRFPPVVQAVGVGFPVVDGKEWCGEFKVQMTRPADAEHDAADPD